MGNKNEETNNSGSVPALRYRFLTPLYESVFQVTLHEKKWRSAAVDGLEENVVLELGYGIGTVTSDIARSYLNSSVHGSDIDLKPLDIARSKPISRARNLDGGEKNII